MPCVTDTGGTAADGVSGQRGNKKRKQLTFSAALLEAQSIANLYPVSIVLLRSCLTSVCILSETLIYFTFTLIYELTGDMVVA